MADLRTAGRRLPMSRNVTAALAVLVLVLGVGAGVGVGMLVSDQTSQVAGLATLPPDASPGSSFKPADPEQTATPALPTVAPSVAPSVGPSATPTPEPTPVIVEPLTGLPVSEKVAKRRVIAVMIDDLWAARPQSGLSSASVVWHAPAEGGIPRYMALFGAGRPSSVGPIRSSRLYYIAWASEWRSVYVHVGGSPQAMAYLATPKGSGKAVYNADHNRWGGKYLWRIGSRYAPHNVYTDEKNLRKLAKAVGGDPYEKVPEPAWRFAPDAPLEMRPTGGVIEVPYTANRVQYTYDRKSNTYRRSVSVEGKQIDAGNDTRIAPKNVVVMKVPFVPTGDKKGRLDGQVTGTGKAWFFTNGKVVKGTWKKTGFTAPTRFFGPDGKPVTLTAGQTFIQVIPRSMAFTFTKGRAPAATPAPSAQP
jgi:hypothetical protein